MKTKVIVICSLLATLPLMGAAQDRPPSAKEVVEAFHSALASGDREMAIDLLDPAVTIFESGGAELSRDEYAHHHLGPDMEFAAATVRDITDQQEAVSGDVAWVLTRSTTQGTFRDREIDLLGVETVLLHRTDSGWSIAHFHWSSRPKSKSR